MIDYTHQDRIRPTDPSIWRVPVQTGPVILRAGDTYNLTTGRVTRASVPVVGARIDYRKAS